MDVTEIKIQKKFEKIWTRFVGEKVTTTYTVVIQSHSVTHRDKDVPNPLGHHKRHDDGDGEGDVTRTLYDDDSQRYRHTNRSP